MGDAISAFIEAIPAAASSPLALVAFLAALAAWTYIAYRVKRFGILMDKIESLPEIDRRAVIEAEFRNAKIPLNLSSADYLIKQKQDYIFYAFLVLCASILILMSMTFYETFERRQRSDNLIGQIFDAPSSQLQSSTNVLSNGPEMIAQAASAIRPPPSQGELAEIVDRLVQSGLRDAETINRRLSEMSGGGQLQEVSRALNGAASNINEALQPLADCYRRLTCGDGKRFADMCKSIKMYYDITSSINGRASKIPGVLLNTTGEPPLFGNGSMDVYFDMVNAENVNFLHKEVCTG
ncbi:hypothetical protein HFO27_20555 [Rhizobium leguminosarum]|uniref:hypothetical protein n=1 Tax=Rhizobium leguminosarum TaxID=384 RepID=UPI001C91B004|nr:hypothetical protein [Rhizobium leguminosarum]MBY3176996.1 hypothetical protein [Rhizobium leguminosarum]